MGTVQHSASEYLKYHSMYFHNAHKHAHNQIGYYWCLSPPDDTEQAFMHIHFLPQITHTPSFACVIHLNLLFKLKVAHALTTCNKKKI